MNKAPKIIGVLTTNKRMFDTIFHGVCTNLDTKLIMIDSIDKIRGVSLTAVLELPDALELDYRLINETYRRVK